MKTNRPFAHLRRWIIAACTLTTAGVVVLSVAQHAQARMRSALHEAAALLEKVAGASAGSATQSLTFNGHELGFVSANVSHTALADFVRETTERCRRNAPRGTLSWLGVDPAYASVAGNEAVVACLHGVVASNGSVNREHGHAAHGVADRLVFLRAEQRDDAVHMVGVVAGGPVDLQQLFPSQGDAPGFDPPGLVRPPSGRRVASLTTQGGGYGVWVYADVKHSGAAIGAHFGAELARSGWRPVPVPNQASERATSWVFERGTELAIVSAPNLDVEHSVTVLVANEVPGEN